MRYFSGSAVVAGILLAALCVVPDAVQAQATSGSKPKPKPKPKPAAQAPKPKPTPAAPVSAPVVITPVAVAPSLRKSRNTISLPDTRYFKDGRAQVKNARIAHAAVVSLEVSKQQQAEGQSVFYDEVYTYPKYTVLENLMLWRDHLVLQLSLKTAELDRMLASEEVTLLAPADAALFPVSDEGRLSAEQLRPYIIKGAHRLAGVIDGDPITLTTVDGTELRVQRDDKRIVLIIGNKPPIEVTITDVLSANGFISIISQPILLKDVKKK